MANKTYKMVELVGTSTKSWEDAIQTVVSDASDSLSDLRIAEVERMDVSIADGKINEYRVKVKLSFKYEKG